MTKIIKQIIYVISVVAFTVLWLAYLKNLWFPFILITLILAGAYWIDPSKLRKEDYIGKHKEGDEQNS